MLTLKLFFIFRSVDLKIGGVGRAGLTACAWAIKMGYVQPHPSLVIMEEAARRSLSERHQRPSQVQGGAQDQNKTNSNNNTHKDAQFKIGHKDHQTVSTSSWISSITPGKSQSSSSPEMTSSSSSSLDSNPTSTGLGLDICSSTNGDIPAELEHQIVMSIVERVIAMIRSRRGLKAIESFEQVQFLVKYTAWLRASVRASA